MPLTNWEQEQLKKLKNNQLTFQEIATFKQQLQTGFDKETIEAAEYNSAMKLIDKAEKHPAPKPTRTLGEPGSAAQYIIESEADFNKIKQQYEAQFGQSPKIESREGKRIMTLEFDSDAEAEAFLQKMQQQGIKIKRLDQEEQLTSRPGLAGP